MTDLRTIWHAAKTGDHLLLRELIENEHVCFYERDAFDATPYQHGCLYGHPRVVQYLLSLYEKHNVEIPQVEREVCIRGCTNKELKKFLQGQQSLDQAISNDDEERRVDALSIWDAAKEGELVKMRYVARYYRPQNLLVRDSEGHTALYYACLFNHPASVVTLLPAFQNAMESEEWEVELKECRECTSCDVVRQVLSGEMTMKEVMLRERKQPKRDKVPYVPSVPAANPQVKPVEYAIVFP